MTTQSKDTVLLGNEPMLPLFFKTAIPIIIAMLVAGLYNVVDAIYIARGLGASAMGAVSTVFPLQMLIAACAALVSTGAASLMVRYVGAGHIEDASNIASIALRLSLAISAVFTLLGLFCLPMLLTLLGVSETLIAGALEYARPIMLGSVAAMVLPLMADTFRSEGRMGSMMLLILAASLLNIVLDPIFIFVLDMGVFGAAVATVLAQVIAIGLGLVNSQQQPTLIRFYFDRKLNWSPAWLMLGLGLPIFIAQLSVAVQAGCINFLLQSLNPIDGDLWVSAYGVLGRLFTFIFLPMIGMLVAFQTICGFNIGAKKPSRVKQSIWVALKVMSLYAFVVMMLVMLFPQALLLLFTNDPQLLQTSKNIIYLTLWTFPTAGIVMVATGYYQAVGQAKLAALYSGLRVFLVFVPIVGIFSAWLGHMGVFISLPVADVIAVLITVLLCQGDYRKLSGRTTAVEI